MNIPLWHAWSHMPKRSSRKMDSPDENQIAFGIAQKLGGDAPDVTQDEIRRVMSALGRLGGKKGGPARDKSLTKAEKAEIGRKGALAMWAKRGKKARKRG